MIYLFTGNGKGKTSAALGMAFRAAGYGLRSVIVQFLKKRITGEVIQAESEPLIEIYPAGKEGWTNFQDLTDEDYLLAELALVEAKELILARPFMLVLDEFNLAVSNGLIKTETALDFLKASCENVHIILTGREAPADLLKIADLVTEFNEVKHPYRTGQKVIKGLDF
ncbi:cob(I)yrinic acid a,c-diamide adenosyltransferase [Patescibacteria group bacterium]|nr:cob(I)yrinic acid a,c-diamide adenosyltransferase [Patescibacteria group bacterium]MBU1868237.1 cob(I)yrinic acid a,c-diamide adenosyltransferase [Patescibacteria group bacterium]